MDLLQDLFGSGSDLNVLQMSARAASVFVLTLLMLRTAGRRSMGLHTAFDACTTVLLGAVLSRAVVGASPFIPTVAAAIVLVAMHRLIALINIQWPWFERLVNGNTRELVSNGRVNAESMRKSLLTRNDLEEAVRKKTGGEKMSDVRRAVLERDGGITVVPRDQG